MMNEVSSSLRSSSPQDVAIMKNELTYWLPPCCLFETFYGLHYLHPILCSNFVNETLGHKPPWIKLTISPFKRRGYTEAKLSEDRPGVLIGRKSHGISTCLENDLNKYQMPSTVWFKLEEWA